MIPYNYDQQVQDEINELAQELEDAMDEAVSEYAKRMQPYEESINEYIDNAPRLLSNVVRRWQQKSLDLVSSGFAEILSVEVNLGQSRDKSAETTKRYCWQAIEKAFGWTKSDKTDSEKFAEWLGRCELKTNFVSSGVLLNTAKCNEKKQSEPVARRLACDFSYQFERHLRLLRKSPPQSTNTESQLRASLLPPTVAAAADHATSPDTENLAFGHRDHPFALTEEVEPRREKRNEFVCMGDSWQITFEGRQAMMRGSKGVIFLALLLKSPGKAIYASELHALATGNSPDTGIELELADPIMDKTARDRLERRFEELNLQRQSAEAKGDEDELQRIELEMERLGEAATAMSHSKAHHTGGAEKARKNVSNQVDRAIRKLASMPDMLPLSVHLEKSVRKGRFLSYQGEREWTVVLPPTRS